MASKWLKSDSKAAPEPAPAPAPAPPNKPVVRSAAPTVAAVPPSNAAVAQATLSTYWSTRGDQGLDVAAAACRALSREQLKMIYAWIPQANPGSSTAIKCDRARLVVDGILAEKGAA